MIYMLREIRCALEGETLGLRSAGRGGQHSRSHWMVDQWAQLAPRGRGRSVGAAATVGHRAKNPLRVKEAPDGGLPA
jgi:hypothetical protein